MDEIIKLHKRLTALLSKWDRFVDDFILDNEALFIDTVHDQLRHGKGGDGGRLDSYSTDEYSKFKKAIGSISSPIADLYVSGDFYEGMSMDNAFKINSSDWKNDVLKQMWGDDIMEVSDSNLNILIKEELLPNFIAKIEHELFG